MPKVQPSVYETARQEGIAVSGAHVFGAEVAAACIVSAQPLATTAQQALLAGLAARGYTEKEVAFIELKGQEGAPLAPEQLMCAIEALDPLCVVLADRASTEAASAGYNVPVALESRELLLGRACRAFQDFGALLSTEAEKRRAWAALKTLPECP